MKNELIYIVTQAFYGNRTGTEIRGDEVDAFILGYQDGEIPATALVDRTIVHLPGSDKRVLVYNKHREAERLKDKERYFAEEGYVLKPLAVIPELGMEIYSRCIVCRMNDAGELESLGRGDHEIWGRYLAP